MMRPAMPIKAMRYKAHLGMALPDKARSEITNKKVKVKRPKISKNSGLIFIVDLRGVGRDLSLAVARLNLTTSSLCRLLTA